ncbi:MAG TPA: hypothetical protein VM075_04730, partial [Anaerolineae bacterium]|nr:hypothetical protein [Anaerolineae bacterium]
MLSFIIGAFMVLHGLVHFLYVGHSLRLFELQSGMVWPEGSWAFSRLVGDQATRLVASISYTLAAIGFVAGGAAILLRQAWWRPVVVGSAAFSAVMVFLFWNGKLQRLDNQ